jgi:hypothetical protein
MINFNVPLKPDGMCIVERTRGIVSLDAKEVENTWNAPKNAKNYKKGLNDIKGKE